MKDKIFMSAFFALLVVMSFASVYAQDKQVEKKASEKEIPNYTYFGFEGNKLTAGFKTEHGIRYNIPAVRVQQIIDENNMIISYDVGKYERVSYWLEANTRGLVDGDLIRQPFVICSGTVTYDTALGSQKTVRKLIEYDVDELAKEMNMFVWTRFSRRFTGNIISVRGRVVEFELGPDSATKTIKINIAQLDQESQQRAKDWKKYKKKK